MVRSADVLVGVTIHAEVCAVRLCEILSGPVMAVFFLPIINLYRINIDVACAGVQL